MILFFPETMGRNLEEIDLMFKDSPSIWSTVRFAKNRPLAMPQEYAGKPSEKAKHLEDDGEGSS